MSVPNPTTAQAPLKNSLNNSPSNSSSNSLNTIVLTDPFWEGHHLTYLQLFTQILLQQGYRVLVLCPKPDEIAKLIAETMPSYSASLFVDCFTEPKSPQVKIKGMGSLFPTFWRWYSTAKAIAKASKKFNLSPDLVFFCWLDLYLYYSYSSRNCRVIYKLADLAFPYKWTGILFHTVSPEAVVNPNVYRRLGAENCKAIAVLHEDSANKLQHLGKKVEILPDVADDSAPDLSYDIAQKLREKADGRKVVGLLGYLEKRKNLLSLLEIAKQSTDKPWFFLFAGKLSQDFSESEQAAIAQFVESQPDNCLFLFERIPQESQFNALVNECDVLYAVYQDFPGSSNTLTKAAIFQKLVLVAQGYLMESRTKEFNLGLSVDNSQNDLSPQIQALEILLDRDRFYQDFGLPKFDEYASKNSRDQMRNTFLDLISS